MFWWASRIRAVSFKEVPQADLANVWSASSSLTLIAAGRVKSIAHYTQTNLFGLVLLGVARRNKTLGVHLHGVDVRRCLARRGRQALHLQKGLDVLHFWLVGAVGHRLALGSQDACSFPLGVLCFLQHRAIAGQQQDINPRVEAERKWCESVLHCHIGCRPHSSRQQLGAAAWCQTSYPSRWHRGPPHNLR